MEFFYSDDLVYTHERLCDVCGLPISSVLFPIRNRSLFVRQVDRCSTVQCNAGQSVVMFRNTAGFCRNWTILLTSSGVKGFEAILHKNNEIRMIKMSGFCLVQHKAYLSDKLKELHFKALR